MFKKQKILNGFVSDFEIRFFAFPFVSSFDIRISGFNSVASLWCPIRLTIVLTLLSCSLYTRAFAQLTKLNVGYVGVTSDNAAAFIARETGIYARNGLDVQLIYFNSGSTAVTALITGDTPISQTAGPGVINATLNGSDTVMIARGNVTLDYWMLSRPEIRTPEQLKGGAVAISRFGSASDFMSATPCSG